MTGLHTVADIHCNVCDTVLGWKYVRVHPSTSRALLSGFGILAYADILCLYLLFLFRRAAGSVRRGAKVQGEQVLSRTFSSDSSRAAPMHKVPNAQTSANPSHSLRFGLRCVGKGEDQQGQELELSRHIVLLPGT